MGPVTAARRIIEGRVKHAQDGLRTPVPEADLARLREAGDDHFYGPWKGGGKSSGGRPALSGGGASTNVNPGKSRDRWTDHDSLVSEMEAKYPGASFADAKKMPITIASDSVDAIDTLNARFGTPPNFQGIRVGNGPPGVLAEVKRVNPAVPGSAVYLYGPFRSQSAMDAQMQSAAGKKHFVQGAAGGTREFTRGIVIHEMGHQYLGLNLHARLGANRDAAVRKELEPFLHNSYFPGLGTSHVSKYARRNPHEGWAELFTAAVTGWPTQSSTKDPVDYPKAARAILDKHYPVSIQESLAMVAWLAEAMAPEQEAVLASAVDEAGHICGFAYQHPDLFAEAGEAHFYGPWSGGPKGGGGRPSNSATDPGARAAFNAQYHQDMDAGHLARLESGAIPSGVVDGKRVELYRLERPDVYRTIQGSYHVDIPASRVTDVRDRWGSMKQWQSDMEYRRSGRAMKSKVREAGDDHFYGPWSGGAKGSGGRPDAGPAGGAAGAPAGAPEFANVKEANTWAAANMDPDLHGQELRAAKEYTDGNYGGINYWCRGIDNNQPGFRMSRKKPGSVDHLDSMMASHTTPVALSVTRNCSLRNWGGGSYLQGLAGKTITEPAYMSTNIGHNAVGFGAKAVKLNIQVPAGTHAVWLGGVSKFKAKEAELLIARGTRLHITKVERTEGKWQVFAEVVP